MAEPSESTYQTAYELFSKLPGLPHELADALSQVAVPLEIPTGASIVTEGERSDHLFVIVSGDVLVFRAAYAHVEEHRVVVLGAGEMLGELALIDGEPRATSARAESDCRLLMIRPADLMRLPRGDFLLANLKAALGATVVRRMRGLTDNYVAALEKKLDAAREQAQFGKFFLYTMSVMAVGLVTNNLLLTHLVNITANSMEFAWIFALILVMPSIVIVKVMRIPAENLGLTRKGMGRSLVEAGGISAVLALLTTGLVVAGVLPGPKGPIFDPIPLVAYSLHSFLQELFARGFFQSSFQRFLDDRQGAKSVIFTSLLFGLFHIHFGLAAVAVTAIGGFIFGAFYLRHPNLAGVTLLHLIVGMCAFNSGLL